nr:MAG TPA: hypothetical protein [Caudoviricetes sp.]
MTTRHSKTDSSPAAMGKSLGKLFLTIKNIYMA